MYKIKTLNPISPVYRDILAADKYLVSPEAEQADAVIVRSADMLNLPIEDNWLCVGRAGVGVNNIPLDMSRVTIIIYYCTNGQIILRKNRIKKTRDIK